MINYDIFYVIDYLKLIDRNGCDVTFCAILIRITLTYYSYVTAVLEPRWVTRGQLGLQCVEDVGLVYKLEIGALASLLQSSNPRLGRLYTHGLALCK